MAGDARDEIKARLDIVDVIGGYVSLTRSGRGFKALCPFHSEKSPSFSVSQEKQAYYCFGCRAGGDLFSFVQQIEHLDFRPALELLAERAGVEVEARRGDGPPNTAARKRRALELHTKAQEYFEWVLWQRPEGAVGRALLQQRTVDEAMARTFGIGFAPAGGSSLISALTKRFGATLDELVEHGLAHPPGRGHGGRDRFRNRLTFPIRDERGAVVGFGARALGDDQPKYLNSPETAIYHKSMALYGIDLARESMRAGGSVTVVEGYFDVVALHRAGLTNVVASSGTALTREQARFMARFATTVTLCLDGDEAGQAASSRAVDILAAENLSCRIAELPQGFKDPDEVVRRDPEVLRTLLSEARPEWQVLIDRALGDGEGGSLEQRRQAADRVAQVLARIPEATTRDLYLPQVARRLDLTSHRALADVVAKVREDTARRPTRIVAAAPTEPEVSAEAEGLIDGSLGNSPTAWERSIATLVVHRPALARQLLELGVAVSELRHPYVRHLVDVALVIPEGEAFSLHQLGEQERAFCAGLLLADVPELEEGADPERLRQLLGDDIKRIRRAALQAEAEQTKRALRAATEEGRQEDAAALAERLPQLAAEMERQK